LSTQFNDIRAALDTQLDTLGLTVAYENVSYEPVEGSPYVRATLLPAETEQLTLGATGKDRHTGLYQIDVIFAAGDSAVTATPDTIADAFKRGSSFTYNGLTVSIRSASIDSGRREAGWFIVPVIIRYYATTTARS